MKSIISIDQLHKIVCSENIKKIQLIGQITIDSITYDEWIVDMTHINYTQTFYTPQS